MGAFVRTLSTISFARAKMAFTVPYQELGQRVLASLTIVRLAHVNTVGRA
jgi:hypothetical protein